VARFAERAGEIALELDIHPRANGRARCSSCGRRRADYDTLAPRRYEFVALWDIKVFFVYAPRRVSCWRCGVKVEALPWSTGKRHLTDAYAWFLADWAKRVSWKEVAGVFRTSWEQVFRAVEMAMNWGP
jgi:transposase